MHRLAVAAIGVSGLLITGCGRSPRDQLQGKWVGDSVQGVHPSQLSQADGWAKGTHLEFSGNKVTVSIPAESPRTGTFKIAKTEGKSMDMVWKRAEGVEDPTTVELTEDGRLIWKLEGGPKIVMRRI